MSVTSLKPAKTRTGSKTQPRGRKKRRGGLPLGLEPSQVIPDQWMTRVNHALRNLGDRSELNRSPLARLAYVERVAETKYLGRILPRGLALRSVLLECVDKIIAELGNEPGLAIVCRYLEMRSNGVKCCRISVELGLSREHVSRTVGRKALELLTEELLAVTKSKRQWPIRANADRSLTEESSPLR